jgi:hypothetical protein
LTGKRRFAVKLAAALLAGLPLTIVPAFYLAWGFFAGIEGVFGPPRERAVQAGALTLVWSLGGILGIAGFWAWVFLARNARQKVRNLIAVLLAAGIAALASAAFPLPSGEGILLALGALLALAVPCLLLLKPRLSWNPDRPDAA